MLPWSLHYATQRAKMRRERKNRVASVPSTSLRAGGMTEKRIVALDRETQAEACAT